MAAGEISFKSEEFDEIIAELQSAIAKMEIKATNIDDAVQVESNVPALRDYKELLMNMQEILEKYRVLLDADTATISKSIHTIQKLDDKIGVQISHK